MYIYILCIYISLEKVHTSINLHVCVDVCMNVCMDIWIEKGAGIVLGFFPFVFFLFGISYSVHFPY
jgi:hypothetical protein